MKTTTVLSVAILALLFGCVSSIEDLEYPVGAVMLFDSNATPPVGWTDCNGDNNTTDMRGRFIVMANIGSPTGIENMDYNVGDINGEAFHTLVMSEIPEHDHGLPDSIMTDISYSTGTPGSTGVTSYVRSSITESKDNVGYAGERQQGGDRPHENRPPYYALRFLCYIGT